MLTIVNAAFFDLISRLRGAGFFSPVTEVDEDAVGVVEDDEADDTREGLRAARGREGAARMVVVTCSARVGRVESAL